MLEKVVVETDLLVLLEEDIKHSIKENTNFFNETCQIPFLESKGTFPVLTQRPCKIKENIGYIRDNIWQLTDYSRTEYSDLACSYREIERIDDFKVKQGDFKELKDGQKILDEVFEVSCVNNRKTPKFKFNNIYVQIVSRLDEREDKIDEKLHKPDKNNCSPLNVILLSYDSVSRVSWINRLPKTHQFVTKDMNFEVLSGYNIVGDGTPAGKINIFDLRCGKPLV